MIVEREYSGAIAELGKLVVALEEKLTPSSVQPLENNAYRLEYAWQFAYERRFFRAQALHLDPHRAELIGTRGLFSEALSNAYVHGNGRDGSAPIFVSLHVGCCGLLLRVSHEGRGFDVADTLAKFRAKRNYYRVAGNGLRRLDASSSFQAFYGNDGRSLHLMHVRPTP